MMSSAAGLAEAGVVRGATERAHATVPLVVYSAQGYDKVEVEAFQKATGITVSLEDNSTGPLLTQIEASKNNPKWGLLWVDGATAMAGLDTQHLLLTGYEPTVSWNSLGKQALPVDKSYIPTGVTLTGAMAYNSAVVKSPPATWQDLLASQWKNKVGMNDPSQSGPTYPFVAGLMKYLGGLHVGQNFYTQLKAHGLVINPTNGPTLSALAAGQIDIALVQSSAAVGATFTDSKIKVKYLDPVTVLPSAIGIDAKAPKQEQLEAEQFAKFVLSPAGQKVMQTGDPQGDSLYYPVLDGMKPLAALPSLSGVHTQTIDPYVWGPKEAAINAWFDKYIVQ
jgi:iron(III) transport system substrate-binding protein